ncbi:MAG: sodium:alanine symporter family protein [Oscillospiraceae bacterium]|nr:sodium:alanine symporter family protein [Oscillospiraceae bacterium]
MEMIMKINSTINGIVWGAPALILIVGTGLFMSVRLGFPQFRKFGYVCKSVVGKIFSKTEQKEGAVTPFQAMCTALAGTVGTGNIAGVCGAIAIGGPGAVFWMWISALLGMATKFSEITLAVHYRERNSKGELVGGPMYYIKNGLGKKWAWLGAIFAFLTAVCALGTGNAIQSNTIASSIIEALHSFNLDFNEQTVALIIGVVLAVLTAIVYFGGVQRIGQVCELLIPGMALIFIVAGIGVVVIRADQIPAVFGAIFKGAFNPGAVAGGLVGTTMMTALQKGVARGVFSNEAGLGTAPIAHAAADVDHPVAQGIYGIFEVFCDTIVICTLTALIVLCGNGIEGVPYGEAANQTLTTAGFCAVYPEQIATTAVAIALSLFAFSTILGWGVYGGRTAEYVFGEKASTPYKIIYCLMVAAGAVIDLKLVWDISDTLNGLMSIPNLIGVLLLSPVVVKLAKEYFADKK